MSKLFGLVWITFSNLLLLLKISIKSDLEVFPNWLVRSKAWRICFGWNHKQPIFRLVDSDLVLYIDCIKFLPTAIHGLYFLLMAIFWLADCPIKTDLLQIICLQRRECLLVHELQRHAANSQKHHLQIELYVRPYFGSEMQLVLDYLTKLDPVYRPACSHLLQQKSKSEYWSNRSFYSARTKC